MKDICLKNENSRNMEDVAYEHQVIETEHNNKRRVLQPRWFSETQYGSEKLIGSTQQDANEAIH